MLKIFHKHQKSVPVIILALLACVSMLPFGTGMGGSGNRDAYAIKVNGEEISQSDFNLVKNNLENLYRQQFGDYYAQLVKSANINVTQQTIDRLIESELLRQFNKSQGLVPSESAIQDQIQRFFGGNYTKEELATFLRNTGQTPQQLRSRLELDLQTSLTSDMLGDFAKLSSKEISQNVVKEQTAYSYQVAKFIPENFKEKVAEPTAEKLQAFYDERVADYEVAEKVQYDYLYFNPANNLDLVEVDLDQIELYYSENQSKFIIPERVKLREIVLVDAEEGAAAKFAEKINSGADFEKVAEEAKSEKTLANARWKNRGDDTSAFESVAFTGQIGSAEVIEADGATRIIRVEDYREESTQDLEKVKDQIKTTLQKQDVAAFLLIKVEDLLAKAKESNQKLAEIAASEGMTIEATNLVTAKEDPTPAAKGLTANVITNSQETLQLQEVKDDVYLVEVKDYQEARYPELEEIKVELTTAWKNEQIDSIATKAAENMLAKVSKKTDQLTDVQFAELAKELGAEISTEDAVKLAEAASKPELRDPQTKKALAASKKGLVDQVFSTPAQPEKYLLFVNEIVEPSSEEVKSAIVEKESQYNQESSRALYQSLVDSLKAQAEIEIANNLRNSI